MILKINRSRTTWQIMNVNFKTKECYSVYLQLSLAKPWLLPKFDNHFSNLDIPLYGWLFFYFGRLTEGVIYETKNDDVKIKDKKTGKKYYVYTFKNRKEKDSMRMVIKNRCPWHLEYTQNKDGTYNVGIICD